MFIVALTYRTRKLNLSVIQLSWSCRVRQTLSNGDGKCFVLFCFLTQGREPLRAQAFKVHSLGSVCVCVCVTQKKLTPPTRALVHTHTHTHTHARTRAHTHTHARTNRHARTHEFIWILFLLLSHSQTCIHMRTCSYTLTLARSSLMV